MQTERKKSIGKTRKHYKRIKKERSAASTNELNKDEQSKEISQEDSINISRNRKKEVESNEKNLRKTLDISNNKLKCIGTNNKWNDSVKETKTSNDENDCESSVDLLCKALEKCIDEVIRESSTSFHVIANNNRFPSFTVEENDQSSREMNRAILLLMRVVPFQVIMQCSDSTYSKLISIIWKYMCVVTWI